MIYRIQQFLIFIIHIALLSWIIFVLHESGQMPMKSVILHFTGMAFVGATLIFGTAQWAKYHHKKNTGQLN